MTKSIKSNNTESKEQKPQTKKKVSPSKETYRNPHYLDSYFSTQDFQEKLITTTTAERWAEDLITFPYSKEGKDAKFISDWYLKRGIPRATFYDMCNKYPQLKAARELYLEAVGTRMYSRAIDRKADLNAVKHIIWRYYPEAAADDQHQVDLKKQIAAEEAKNKPTTITVITDNMKELKETNE